MTFEKSLFFKHLFVIFFFYIFVDLIRRFVVHVWQILSRRETLYVIYIYIYIYYMGFSTNTTFSGATFSDIWKYLGTRMLNLGIPLTSSLVWSGAQQRPSNVKSWTQSTRTRDFGTDLFPRSFSEGSRAPFCPILDGFGKPFLSYVADSGTNFNII